MPKSLITTEREPALACILTTLHLILQFQFTKSPLIRPVNPHFFPHRYKRWSVHRDRGYPSSGKVISEPSYERVIRCELRKSFHFRNFRFKTELISCREMEAERKSPEAELRPPPPSSGRPAVLLLLITCNPKWNIAHIISAHIKSLCSVWRQPFMSKGYFWALNLKKKEKHWPNIFIVD